MRLPCISLWRSAWPDALFRSPHPCFVSNRACQYATILCALLLGFLTPDILLHASDSSGATPPYVDAPTAQRWRSQGQPIVFLDVRALDEFAAGHLPDARNIAYDHVATIADQLPHDTPIIVYCIHSSHRAPQAALTLQRLGFTNVSVLEGGIVAWQADGLSIYASELSQAATILPLTERCAKATQ